MCGIVGVASTSKIENRIWLRDGREKLKHRGPDDFGEWWSSDLKVGFGHRRLSIFDLSKKASQPMHFNNKNLTGVFVHHYLLNKTLPSKMHVF